MDIQDSLIEKCHGMCIIIKQVLSLLGGSYKAKSAEAFALMKLVQVIDRM